MRRPPVLLITVGFGLLGGCGTKSGDGVFDSGGNSVGGSAVSVASCIAFRGYQESCGLPVTEEEYAACLDNLALIEANCYAGERDRYDDALEALYACLGAATYCPGDTVSEAVFACYQTFDAETGTLLGECVR